MSDAGDEIEVDEEGGVTIEFVDEDGNHLFDSYFDEELWTAIGAMSSIQGITPREFVRNAILDTARDNSETESQDEG